MKLGILRAPHANARYEEATKGLLISAVTITADALGQKIQDLKYEAIMGLELLTFHVDLLSVSFERAIGRIADNYVTFEIGDSGMWPRHQYRTTYFPKDMASIQKYSGKTNEAFTALMLHLAVMSGSYASDFDKPLRLLDPMCGRGTSLYQGLTYGYHMAGLDQDKVSINESQQFIKRYLKYHLFKHQASHQMVHHQGKVLGVKYTIETANSIDAYKAKDKRLLEFANGDTRQVNAYYKKQSFHGLVVDLPYGVQHKGRDSGKYVDLVTLLSESAPEWHKVLVKGAAVVIAYNTHSFERSRVDEAFLKAGFSIKIEGPYQGFGHWVEQAVTRDLLVYVK